MAQELIDAHAHCGRQFTDPPQAFGDYQKALGDSGITGAVFFPPVMEVYDRHDPDFTDTPAWQHRRHQANRYLAELRGQDFSIIPYSFMAPAARQQSMRGAPLNPKRLAGMVTRRFASRRTRSSWRTVAAHAAAPFSRTSASGGRRWIGCTEGSTTPWQ